jgi:hypothetical protein
VRVSREFSDNTKKYLIFIVKSLNCISADVTVDDITSQLQDSDINLSIVVIDNMDRTDMLDKGELQELVSANPLNTGDFYDCPLE